MTEAEWNDCTQPIVVLEFLRTSGRANDRKLRLTVAACARTVSPPR
jgi:hypothetical protein